MSFDPSFICSFSSVSPVRFVSVTKEAIDHSISDRALRQISALKMVTSLLALSDVIGLLE